MPMAKKKIIGVEQTKNYVVEDYKNPPKSQVAKWRRKEVGGHILNIAVLKNGKTVVTSVWHPKTERSSDTPAVRRVLDKTHKGTRRRSRK